jgi:hypothetical protein
METGKTFVQTKGQTPLLSVSGTRKVVKTPSNVFEEAVNNEVNVPKEIIVRRIQEISVEINKTGQNLIT